jgi:hypothetical protein
VILWLLALGFWLLVVGFWLETGAVVSTRQQAIAGSQ